MCRQQKAKLHTPVRWRYEVTSVGHIKRKHRKDDVAYKLYGCPVRQCAAAAYIWPESSDRYVVAIKAETRPRGNHFFHAVGCYHTLPTYDAAIMFALAASN